MSCRFCSSSRRCFRSSSSGWCWWSLVWASVAPTCWATWGAGWARQITRPPCSPGWPTPTSRRRWCRAWSPGSGACSSRLLSQPPPVGDSLSRDRKVQLSVLYSVPTYYQSMWYLYRILWTIYVVILYYIPPSHHQFCIFTSFSLISGRASCSRERLRGKLGWRGSHTSTRGVRSVLDRIFPSHILQWIPE